MTNRQIEDAAIAYVMAWESARGRPARDTRGQGAAGDVAGDVRTIEVKAFGAWARGQDLWLEARQVDEAMANPNFWIYVVENVRQGDPALFRRSRRFASNLVEELHGATWLPRATTFGTFWQPPNTSASWLLDDRLPLRLKAHARRSVTRVSR